MTERRDDPWAPPGSQTPWTGPDGAGQPPVPGPPQNAPGYPPPQQAQYAQQAQYPPQAQYQAQHPYPPQVKDPASPEHSPQLQYPSGYVSPPVPMPPAGAAGPVDGGDPREYPALLRGPKHRWWRPLIGLLVVLGCLLVLVAVSTVAAVVAFFAGGVDLSALEDPDAVMEMAGEPWLFGLNNLVLASMIPVAMLAVWAGHGWRPRWVASVHPGLRWRWMLACLGVALVVQAVSMAVLFAVDGVPGLDPDPNAVLLLVIVALTTPLQCAGEEYLCRGWMTQAIGSWFRRAALGAVIAALVTATVFGLLHGWGDTQSGWLFLDRFGFGILASYLTWRSGGLEAAIAAHTANNLVVLVPTILTGSLSEALLVSEASPGLVGLDLMVMVVVGVLLTVMARRFAVQRRHDPSLQPGGPPATQAAALAAPWPGR